MNKILFSLLFMLYLAGCQSHKDISKNSPVPNIVVIVSDDQGYGDFSCFGSKYLKTPNMDTLYSESVFLSNFYVSTVCSPTRASLLTGRYHLRTGVWDTWKGRAMMKPKEVTLAELLSEVGYDTGIFGKWHLGENIPCRPDDQGFHETYLWDGMDRFDPVMFENGVEKNEKGFFDDLIFDKAIDFISTKRNKPFFAYIPSHLPHTHFRKQVPDSYVERFDKYPSMLQGDKELYAMVEKLDENVGRVLNALKDQKLDDNTIVIFLSDNGPQFNSRYPMSERFNLNLRGHKGQVYNGGIKLPCFIRWPSKLKPKKITENTAHIDIVPTVMGLLGKGLPDSLKIDGIDLSSKLLDSNVDLPDRYIFQQFDRNSFPRPFKNYAVIGPQYKLVNGELYNLENDISESNNLANELPAEVTEMEEAHKLWFEDVTSATSFEPVRTIIGSPDQMVVEFIHTQINDIRKYPVKIKKGKYTLQFTGVQSQLFGPDGELGVRLDSNTISIPVDSNVDELVIQDMVLPEGNYDMDIVTKDKKPKKFEAYGNEDLGFRKLKIIKQ